LRLVLSIVLGAAGNLLEWYDFAIFGIFAQEIGQCYFVATDDPEACATGSSGNASETSSIYSYVLFAGGFLVRPVGGVLFGWVADHKGRATSLMLSIVGMAVPTLAISVLPCRSHIGLAAPLLLTIFRLMQGVAAGGELPGALVYAVERAPVHHKAIFGALVQATGVGSVLANGVAALLLSALGPPALCQWGWRLGFGAGGCGALLICCARLVGGLPQTDEWTAAVCTASSRPGLLRTLNASRRHIALITLVLAYSMAGYYLLFVWITHYLRTERGLSSFGASSLLNTLWAVGVLFSGFLTDRLASPAGVLAGPYCGRRRGPDRCWFSSPATVAMGFGFAMLLASQPVFRQLRTASPAVVAVAQGLLAVVHAMSVGPLQARRMPSLAAAVSLPRSCLVSIPCLLPPLQRTTPEYLYYRKCQPTRPLRLRCSSVSLCPRLDPPGLAVRPHATSQPNPSSTPLLPGTSRCLVLARARPLLLPPIIPVSTSLQVGPLF
jgi:MHS family proline/betaine transporter-like MFS transporter